jgi:hypothetical protein
MRHSDLSEADYHWLKEKPPTVPMVTRSFHNDGCVKKWMRFQS